MEARFLQPACGYGFGNIVPLALLQSIFGALEFTFVTVEAEINIKAIPGRLEHAVVPLCWARYKKWGGGENQGLKWLLSSVDLYVPQEKNDRTVLAWRT